MIRKAKNKTGRDMHQLNRIRISTTHSINHATVPMPSFAFFVEAEQIHRRSEQVNTKSFRDGGEYFDFVTNQGPRRGHHNQPCVILWSSPAGFCAAIKRPLLRFSENITFGSHFLSLLSGRFFFQIIGCGQPIRRRVFPWCYMGNPWCRLRIGLKQLWFSPIGEVET